MVEPVNTGRLHPTRGEAMGDPEIKFEGGRLHIGDVKLGIDDLVRAGQALNGVAENVPQGNDLPRRFGREARSTAMKLERIVWNLYGIGEASWAKEAEKMAHGEG